MGNIEDVTILDLFSGSGIMAVEALSRGAASVTSIEQHPKACQNLHAIAKQFDVEKRWIIKRGVLPKALSSLQHQCFDWVFADPPYQAGIAEKIPVWLAQEHIHINTTIIEESIRAKPNWPQGWQISTRKYGDTHLHFLTKDTQQ
jgi:16S rRNA (guanine966-N2)-methyltransferase